MTDKPKAYSIPPAPVTFCDVPFDIAHSRLLDYMQRLMVDQAETMAKAALIGMDPAFIVRDTPTPLRPGTTNNNVNAIGVGYDIRYAPLRPWRGPSEDPPPPFEGIRVGEILAWRLWRVLVIPPTGKPEVGNPIAKLRAIRMIDGLEPQMRLRSLYRELVWEPVGVGKAELPPLPHTLYPRGYHAFKSIEQARDELAMIISIGPTQLVMGQVWLWGEVVEHETGYRAERAAVASIVSMPRVSEEYPAPPPEMSEILHMLRQTYRVGETA